MRGTSPGTSSMVAAPGGWKTPVDSRPSLRPPPRGSLAVPGGPARAGVLRARHVPRHELDGRGAGRLEDLLGPGCRGPGGEQGRGTSARMRATHDELSVSKMEWVAGARKTSHASPAPTTPRYTSACATRRICSRKGISGANAGGRRRRETRRSASRPHRRSCGYQVIKYEAANHQSFNRGLRVSRNRPQCQED